MLTVRFDLGLTVWGSCRFHKATSEVRLANRLTCDFTLVLTWRRPYPSPHMPVRQHFVDWVHVTSDLRVSYADSYTETVVSLSKPTQQLHNTTAS